MESNKRMEMHLSITNVPETFKRQVEPIISNRNKENYYTGMEVKSIAQMIADKTIQNPYEVIRKPVKKKKKNDIEESCFENPALNINGPENVLNPYEIKRNPAVATLQNDLCFINSGLNIRVPDKKSECDVNFEITRNSCGVENPALDLKQLTPRGIAVPFTPTLGSRINFNDIPLNSLTPCSLLTNKLVLVSPSEQVIPITPKRSVKSIELSAISEETLNIGDELDCYQLELENSINEAKADKRKQENDFNFIEKKTKSTFAQRLELEEEGDTKENETSNAIHTDNETTNDVLFEEVNETSDDEFEFKNPAPFVRTYRRSTRKPINKNINKPTISNSPFKSKEKTGNFRNSIRKSIRKLITAHPSNECKSSDGDTNIFSTIRQSFRRKTASSKVPLVDRQQDISILMDDNRKVFKQMSQTDDEVDINSFGRKASLRRSFRNTTKDVRRHVMKSVFKKNVEGYCLD